MKSTCQKLLDAAKDMNSEDITTAIVTMLCEDWITERKQMARLCRAIADSLAAHTD